MEATIDIEFLQGVNELVIKELAVVSDGILQTFLFRAPSRFRGEWLKLERWLYPLRPSIHRIERGCSDLRSSVRDGE